MMKLSIVRDGHRFPYSFEQLKADNPNVSFPRDLANVDLSSYGVIVDVPDAPVGSRANPTHQRIAMHCFLYWMRELGLRTHFERYILCLEGHARDFWMSAPYVSRSSTYVAHVAETFGLSSFDIDAIFATGAALEE